MDAALTVFTRFGFRKTSMSEVAREANVSRQGLYLHFATKEELFRASVEYALEAALKDGLACLADVALPLERRLLGAFDAWLGRFVGTLGANAAELAAATHELLGPMVAEHEARFVDALARVARTSGLSAAYKPAGLTARQLAGTLYATGRGFKYSATRAGFVEGMTAAVRAMCLPLRETSGERRASGARETLRRARRGDSRSRA